MGQSSGAGDVLELAFLSHFSSISASTPFSGPAEGDWLCTAAAPSSGMRLLVLDLPQLMFCYQCWYFLPGTELHHGMNHKETSPTCSQTSVPASELLDEGCWERWIFFQSVGELGTLGAHPSSAGVSEPVSELLCLVLSTTGTEQSQLCFVCTLLPRCCRQGWLHVKAENSKRQFYPDL